MWYDGDLYESEGEYGQSGLQRVTLETGEVEQRVDLRPEFFGEGLARVDDRLIQITWQAQTAFVYDLETLAFIESLDYSGQGWGLCYDGTHLWMSNGSERISKRDPITFEPVGEIIVTDRGQEVRQLNELECVNGRIYANVWKSTTIFEIVPETGRVSAAIDVSGMMTTAELEQQSFGREVLNGIAYNPEEDLFYLSGKNWDSLFVVRFVPADGVAE